MTLPPVYRRILHRAMLVLASSTGLMLTTSTGCGDAAVTAGLQAVRELSLSIIEIGFDTFIANQFGTGSQVTVQAVTENLTRLIA